MAPTRAPWASDTGSTGMDQDEEEQLEGEDTMGDLGQRCFHPPLGF